MAWRSPFSEPLETTVSGHFHVHVSAMVIKADHLMEARAAKWLQAAEDKNQQATSPPIATLVSDYSPNHGQNRGNVRVCVFEDEITGPEAVQLF
jgi:hypothetical protein